jgi:protein-L-isoaspartate(D-aspartate) O-methyltransferase
VLAAIESVPRERFLGGLATEAELDCALPTGFGQTTTQPSLVALMVESLEVGPSDVVLEVGTGTGYQAAVLSRLARVVYTIERVRELAEEARRNLAGDGVTNVHVETGDGTLGLPDRAPFDRIIVAAAFPEVPKPLVDQLSAGGRLVQPVGPGGAEQVVVFEKRDERLEEVFALTPAAFVRLIGEHGFSP